MGNIQTKLFYIWASDLGGGHLKKKFTQEGHGWTKTDYNSSP